MTKRKPRRLSSISGFARRVEVLTVGDLVPYFESARAQVPGPGWETPVLGRQDFVGAVCHNPILLDGPRDVVAGAAWLLSLLVGSIEDESFLAAPVAVIQIGGLSPGFRRAYVSAHQALDSQPALDAQAVGALVVELDNAAQGFLREWKEGGTE